MPDVVLTVRAENLASQQFARLQQDLQRSNRALRDVGTSASSANPAIARLRQEYRFLSNEVGNVATVSRQFAAAFNSQLQGTIDAAINFERLRRSLETISGSASEASAQYQRLIEVSRLPGLNLEQALRASVQLQAIGTEGERAAEIITEFGNALALGGGSARDLNQIVNSIRQMSAEGRVLQEDLSIMTTRVSVLVPILEEAFGGVRAEDIRNSGTSAEEFIQIVTTALAQLPRAGETAQNAIENLSDTAERAQAAIGTQLLPAVRDFTATAEGLLSSLENASPAVQRTIAIAGVLGTTFLTVTAGAAGLTAALPALGAALTFLTANPIGIAITAIAAVTAGIVAWRVATADAQTAQEQLANSLASQDYSAVITGIEVVRDRIAEVRAEIEAINQTDEEGRGFFGSIFESVTRSGARERATLLGEQQDLEAQAAQAGESVVADLSTTPAPDQARRDVVTRSTQETAPPEQRATFGLTVEGALSESDVANINSAVQSLSMLGENQEVPQVLHDLNTAMAEADTAFRITTESTRGLNPFLIETSEQTGRLGTSIGNLAIAVPTAATTVSNLSAELANLSADFETLGTPELFDLQVALEPLETLARLPDLESPLRSLNDLIESVQTFNATRTGAADIGLPVIGAEADPDRDRFAGAFNLSALFGDVSDEFQGYGRQFGEAIVTGLISQEATVVDVITGFVTASFQDLGTVLGGNIGDQISGAITGRLGSIFEGVGVGAGALGPLALASVATLAAPVILQSILGSDQLTPEQLEAHLARGGAGGGLGVGAGLGQFAGAIPVEVTNLEDVFDATQIASLFEGAEDVLGIQDELAERFGVVVGESIEETRDFAQERADLIVSAIQEGAAQNPELISSAINSVFADADLYTNATARELAERTLSPQQRFDPETIAATNRAELLAAGGDPRDPSTFVSDTGETTAPTLQPDATGTFPRLATEDILLVGQSLAGQTLTIMPEGGVMPITLQQETLRVEVVNKPEIAIPDVVRMAADSPLPVVIDGTPTVAVDGTVQVAGTVNLGGAAIPVIIQNTEVFVRNFQDTESTLNRLGAS